MNVIQQGCRHGGPGPHLLGGHASSRAVQRGRINDVERKWGAGQRFHPATYPALRIIDAKMAGDPRRQNNWLWGLILPLTCLDPLESSSCWRADSLRGRPPEDKGVSSRFLRNACSALEGPNAGSDTFPNDFQENKIDCPCPWCHLLAHDRVPTVPRTLENM